MWLGKWRLAEQRLKLTAVAINMTKLIYLQIIAVIQYNYEKLLNRPVCNREEVF